MALLIACCVLLPAMHFYRRKKRRQQAAIARAASRRGGGHNLQMVSVADAAAVSATAVDDEADEPLECVEVEDERPAGREGRQQHAREEDEREGGDEKI